MTARTQGLSTSGDDARPLYAMGLRLLSMLMLSTTFAMVKWLSELGVHIVEALFYRQLFALPVAFIGMMMGAGLSSLKTERIGAHLGRTAVGLTGMTLNFGSVILLPLAEATTIGFTVPIFATILSVLILRERPGIHRWFAVVTGFIGVLVIIGPGRADSDIPAIGLIVAILGAITTSMISPLLRQLGRTESTITTVFYFSLFSLPPLMLGMLYFAQMHEPFIWLLLLGLGLIGGVAQLLMTAALRWGPVSMVLPMDYSTLLWSTLFGWLLWNSWPGPWTWAGAAIIVGSSTYIAWREHIRSITDVNRGVSIS